MLPYYAYSGDYVEAFNRSLDAALDGHGYTSSNVKKSEIDRNTSLNMSWTVIVSTDIILEDEYYCMFASIIGINKIPIRVSAKSRQPMSIGEPYYDGQPYEVWGEDGAVSYTHLDVYKRQVPASDRICRGARSSMGPHSQDMQGTTL